MTVTRLLRIAMNVGDLRAACAFYTAALGCEPDGPETAATAFPGRARRLRRGRQLIELIQPDAPGAPYPPDTRANDLWFQHCALVTGDIAALHAHLATFGVQPFSRPTPVTLPGGIAAWKFRDPDGHPLELIQFPTPDPATSGGLDHSAISVADPARSLAFYRTLGLTLSARQTNTGPAQDALDGLNGVQAEVIALTPTQAAPHLELLAYRNPPGRPPPALPPTAMAATRAVFEAAVPHPQYLHDPDGHALLLEPPSR